MKIKRMHATFGNLHERTLVLDEGMNVLSGSNESGKSTWSAFLRVMLYGISTREKSKQGFLADKEKYAPWSGVPMYGRIEFEWEGRRCTLERTASKTGILQKAELKDAETGQIIPISEPVGETILGIKREVFERSAFIGQSQIIVGGDKDGELERRITSLVSTGDEDVSYKVVVSRLEKWQRKLEYHKKGEIPSLEDTIAITRNALLEQRQDAAQITEARHAIDECNKRRATYQDMLNKWCIKKACEQLSFINKTKEEKKCCEDALILAQRQCRYDKYTIDQIEQTYEEYKRKKIQNVECVHAMQMEQAILQGMVQVPDRIPPHGLFAAVSGIVCFAVLIFINWIIALVSAIIVAGVTFSILKNRFYRKFGIKNRVELSVKAEEYHKQKKLVDAYYLEAEKAKSMFFEEEKNLLDILESLDEVIHPQDVEKYLSTAREKFFALEQAEREVRAANDKLNAVQVGRDMDALSTIAKETADITMQMQYSVDELQILTEQSERELRDLEHRCIALTERMSARGELIALEEIINEKEVALAQKRVDMKAIQLALETLHEVQGEIERQFAPALEKKTSEIFAKLTGGRFQLVEIKNAQLEISVAEHIASPSRDILHLSQGTLDELYLAMRLALCETILPESIPIILDDALVNFDDMRMGKALNCLEKLSNKRQILLFSCHKRELEYFKNSVHIHKQIVG